MTAERYGAGPAQGLALHCMLARGRAWAEVGAALGDRMTLVAPDLPGHGAAPEWDGAVPYGLAALALAEGACPAGPVHLIGHSFGAVTALRLAARAPDRVASLTLIEPVWFYRAMGRPGQVANAVRFEAVRAAVEAGETEAAARLFTERWGGGDGWDAIPERRRASMAARIRLIVAQQAELESDLGLADAGLGALGMPILLMEGASSPAVVGEILDAMAPLWPTARRVRIAGAGHMLPITHPGPVAAEIGALL